MAGIALTKESLRYSVDPDSLGFERLSQAPAAGRDIVAQERAVEALNFGLRIRHPDFNVFVAGDQETGLADLARAFVEETARAADAAPSDWCYVHNFRDPDAPLAVELPRGEGRRFQAAMAELVDNLRLHVPKIFESETYLARKEEVIRGFNKARAGVFEELDAKVRAQGFLLQADQSGMMVMPAKEGDTPMTPEDIAALSEEEQKALRAKSEDLHREMGAAMRRIHEMEHDVRRRLKDLDRELVGQTADSLMEELRAAYGEHPVLSGYLSDVREDVVRNMDAFRQKAPEGMPPFPFPGMGGPSFTQYEVNVLVDHGTTEGAPVVFEANPTYANLFGTVERKAQFGALFTDFTMIRAGALHRANGGYLVVKALDLLKWPFSYEALKRCLRHRRLEVEDLGEQLGVFSTKTLKPKPVPLDVKVILLGAPEMYHLLYNLDEDFRDLFKVKAHMDTLVDRDEAHLAEYLGFLRSLVERGAIRDLDKGGVARILEYSAELAGSQDKLTLRREEVADILREADYWASADGSGVISAAHVQRAVDAKERRAGLYADRIQELLRKDVLKVATDGAAVGQVNGLAIHDLGDTLFGKPARITAAVSLGKEGVVNVEREAELSGRIHTKGVVILSGYLRSRFAADKPLTLTATLCFEQSYGMVDGDSASAAELFALLSALSGVPIDQGRAVTGAVSQTGQILPIGGVSKKIEGFFDLCAERGLTGSQGVLIPEANVRDLMLKPAVVEAVAAGRFHVWAIHTVEEGIELLTGRPAGTPGPDGRYPDGSLFAMVDARLRALAEEARRFAREEGGGEGRPEGAGST
ncbi:AAA family ATPase [Dissulfurirhabdus thermomarina]|uniref:endopeptidase La n=1 Tax=Dissulfurirhabdus thermomarina TaxID=1765737 RepID=A0A6N9TKU9_DISTH|nr:ATP-binding protein [Dissulfurirhabdus thermomarina]NDY41698.1 AAA family ATPase [Dissulfurirhabdus thermomarina]NMX23183.1 AAA family ATPase [Dissulfurirhabdus thermomarina]